MAVGHERVLPGFKRQVKGAHAGQLEAGNFYRELLSAGFPSAPGQPAGQVHVAAQAAGNGVGAVPPQHDAAVQTVPAVTDCGGAPHSGQQTAASDAAADSTAGLGSEARVEILQPVSRPQPGDSDGTSSIADTTFVGPSLNYAIPHDNVGFKLLQKHGWQVGAGLGAESQGRRMPLEHSQQKGRQGLGAATAAGQQQAKQPQQQQQPQQSQPAKGKQGKGPRIPLPEDSDSFDAKVKRHRQVLQAEADTKAGKAIQRYMYMAFNDTTGEATSDVNPLLRHNKRLSATNPLL